MSSLAMSRNSSRAKMSPAKARKIALGILKYVFMLILVVFFTFPILWMVSNSFKSQEEVYASISSFSTFFPSTWDISKWWTSYGLLFSTFSDFGRSILNSVFYCAIEIVAVLLINSLAGYALARYSFPFSKTIRTFIIIVMLVPVETSVVPTYVILYRLGLLKNGLNIIGYLLPGFCSPMYTYMFRQYFLSIPKEIEEAARLDGCSRLGIFFKIALPLSLPIFATAAIFTFMGQWNEYIFAQLMFTDTSMQPLQVFLQLVNTYNPSNIAVTMCALTISTIPIALVYIFFQKWIVEGVSFSGVKG